MGSDFICIQGIYLEREIRNLVGYIIEKAICHEYAFEIATLSESDGRPKIFSTERTAVRWLFENDEDFKDIPLKNIFEFYNIKPYMT